MCFIFLYYLFCLINWSLPEFHAVKVEGHAIVFVYE